MKKFLKIFIDIFLITAGICIAVISNNKLNVFISGVSVGVWICCFTFDILDFWFKHNETQDKKMENI